MPCEILVRATNHPNGKWLKGFPVVVKDLPFTWGGQEGPPKYVRVRITNGSSAQVLNFLDSFRNVITHEIVAENDLGYRLRLSFSVRIAQLFPDKSNRLELRDYLVSEWGVSIVSHETDSVTLDIPKPVDLAALRADLLDKWVEAVSPVRYRFSDADVDAALAAGGVIEVSRAQAASRIIDRAA